MAYTTIKKSSDYFNTKLYTGNGSTQSITGVGFQPDFTWIKTRSGTYKHLLVDAVRGATKHLSTVNTAAEITNSDNVTAFASDGFNLASDGNVNANSGTYASWNWLANGTGSANTDGSISSTVSASATSGFSIVSFTGTGANATVGHGLGVTPKWIIVKSRGVENWRVYSSYLGATKAMLLNGTNAEDTDSSYWNGEPTSSVFTVGTNAGTNGSSVNMIAYCFADVQGFSKFSSYTGNSSTDGTFIYTGFKPSFVMVKRTDNTSDWQMQDNKRIGYNVNNYRIFGNTSETEYTSGVMDFVSNGFKFRGTPMNTSGGNFIYMAFAEQPLVGDNPATAR